MKLALGSVKEVTHETLVFGRQMGATHVVIHTPQISDDRLGYYDYPDLLRLKGQVEESGLEIAAIENAPYNWYDKVLFGLPGRDQQIENWCTTLKNMGRAGIPILGYHFMALSVWRTSRTTPGRGGALVTSFDYETSLSFPDKTKFSRTIGKSTDLLQGSLERSDQEMWDNLTYFIKAVIPVAEEAGVRMALHPDDPPISPLGGVARIMRSHSALKRLTEIVPSHYNGLEFCQGTVSEMPENVLDAIRYFGNKDLICYVHFRNVSQSVPSFDETFIDEGHVDMLEAMKLYKEVGFTGPIIDDHTPEVIEDTPYGHRGRAYAMGYIKALMQVVGSLK